MLWELTVSKENDGIVSSRHAWPGDAWEAYDAAIRGLEADGFARSGIESVQYGRGAAQRLVRDASEVNVQLARTDA